MKGHWMPHSQETCKAIGDKQRERWRNGIYENRKPKSFIRDVTREKLSLAALRRKARGQYFNEEALKKIRERRRQQVLPFKDTKPEIILNQELAKRGFSYYSHPPFVGQPDNFLVRKDGIGIAIFVDGCYWHDCPNCFPNGGFGRGDYDCRITEELESQGLIVLRFWEHEILADVSECVDRVEEDMLR